MLGPADLRDWEFDEDDWLREEIRIAPLMIRYLVEPRVVTAMLGDEVGKLLSDFQQGAPVTTEDLRRLELDLEAAEDKFVVRPPGPEVFKQASSCRAKQRPLAFWLDGWPNFVSHRV